MDFDFRPLLRQNFRGHILICRPQPSAGGAPKEKQTPGALVFRSPKASLLEAWLLLLEIFLKLQKATLGSTSSRFKDVLQDHGIWLWQKPHLWQLLCYLWKERWMSKFTTQRTEPEQIEILRYTSPAGPRVARHGSPLQAIYNNDP